MTKPLPVSNSAILRLHFFAKVRSSKFGLCKWHCKRSQLLSDWFEVPRITSKLWKSGQVVYSSAAVLCLCVVKGSYKIWTSLSEEEEEEEERRKKTFRPFWQLSSLVLSRCFHALGILLVMETLKHEWRIVQYVLISPPPSVVWPPSLVWAITWPWYLSCGLLYPVPQYADLLTLQIQAESAVHLVGF